MRHITRFMRPVHLLLLGTAVAGCRPPSSSAVPAPTPEILGIVDGRTNAPVSSATLSTQLRGADFVLLGELHDNAAHHRARAALIAANRPVLVFEHFRFGDKALERPASGIADTVWLDGAGFDRKGWRWPLHAPLVSAALGTGRPIWGSNLSSGALRTVVRQGADSAPATLASLVRQVPLDSVGRRLQDQEIIDGHCGKLPVSMVGGMRAAQEVRDAAMAEAMMAARRDGPVWLVAGNGHVREDVAVPRLLRALAPTAQVVSVGFVEVGADGARTPPPPGRYRYVIFTAGVTGREDPCATLTMPAR